MAISTLAETVKTSSNLPCNPEDSCICNFNDFKSFVYTASPLKSVYKRSDKESISTYVETSTTPVIYPYACDLPDNTFCTCTLNDIGDSDVICQSTSMIDARDGFFSKIFNAHFATVTFVPLTGDRVPANLFMSSIGRIDYLKFECATQSECVAFDARSFETSINAFIGIIEIKRCNVLNLNFLVEIKNKVDEFIFYENANLFDVFSTVPYEFKMKKLKIVKNSLLENIDNFPPLFTGLDFFVATSNHYLDDDAIDRFMKWLVDYSVDTLKQIEILDNGLTRVPSMVMLLKQLESFSMAYNDLWLLPEGSLNIHSVPSGATVHADLRYCGIHTIEEGAFQGNNLKIRRLFFCFLKLCIQYCLNYLP